MSPAWLAHGSSSSKLSERTSLVSQLTPDREEWTSVMDVAVVVAWHDSGWVADNSAGGISFKCHVWPIAEFWYCV